MALNYSVDDANGFRIRSIDRIQERPARSLILVRSSQRVTNRYILKEDIPHTTRQGDRRKAQRSRIPNSNSNSTAFIGRKQETYYDTRS